MKNHPTDPFKNWSVNEQREMYSHRTVGSDGWDTVNQVPIFTPAPIGDEDFLTRMRRILPHLASQIPSQTLPSEKVSYSSAMLNAMTHAEVSQAEEQKKQRRSELQTQYAALQLSNGSTGVKLFTNEGKIVSIIQGYVKYFNDVESYPRGDKYTADPIKMIDNLLGMYSRRSRSIYEAKIFYNRDPKHANNRVFYHISNGRILVNRIDELKLLLR